MALASEAFSESRNPAEGLARRQFPTKTGPCGSIFRKRRFSAPCNQRRLPDADFIRHVGKLREKMRPIRILEEANEVTAVRLTDKRRYAKVGDFFRLSPRAGISCGAD